MIKLIKYLFISLISIFILTGCTHKLSYDVEKVSSNVNNSLSKVEDKTVTVFYSNAEYNKVINKNIKGRTFGVSIDMDVGKINNEVLKLFMNQYFKDIDESIKVNPESFLSINSNISNYEWDRFFPDIIHIDMDMKVNAYMKNKLVLSKTYKLRDYSSEVILVFANFTLLPLIQETFHKGALHLYETEVRSDLLKVIKENMNQ